MVEYWWLILWIVAAFVAYVVGGWKLAAIVATFGLAQVAYSAGKNRADAARRERDRAMEKRLEQGYDEIDKRGASADDVRNRLRDGKF